MGFPQERQGRAAGCTATGITGDRTGVTTLPWGKGLPGTGDPHMPQNLVSAFTGAPHDGHVICGFCGFGSTVGAGKTCPAFIPQLPQKLSSGSTGLPHALQDVTL
jgi:hypothetical protein